MSGLFRSTGLAPVAGTIDWLTRGPAIPARRDSAGPAPVASTTSLAGYVMLLLLFSTSGCRHSATSSENAEQQPGAADHADEEEAPITADDVPMPPNYAVAVERLCEYRDAIREAISSRQPANAHRPLDETNIALERLPALARSSGVPRRDWETVVVAGDDLGEALGAIHETIDANQVPDYAGHADAIDDALARLQTIAEYLNQTTDRSAKGEP